MKLLHNNDRLGEHAPSWYSHTSSSALRASLTTHIDTDVCIIGAGFTGLSAACELRKQGIDCVIVDAHRVGWGASGRNGGQLGTGFNMSQTELESQLGSSQAHALWEIAEQAKQWIRNTCEEHNHDIDYKKGIVYAMHRKRFVKPLHDYCAHLHENYAYHAMQPLDRHSIQEHVKSDQYHGGVVDYGAGHIHPLKLSHALADIAEANGAALFECSEAIRINRRNTDATQRVVTPMGSVTCKRLILATNGYLDSLHDKVSKRLMPINNFIVVTEPLGKLANEIIPDNVAVADSRFVVNYYRRVAEDRLLFGGGENYSYHFPDNITPLVRKAMLGVFPQLREAAIDYAWGGTLAITRNRLPFIAEVAPRQFAAGGYSGHGVALACIYGKALADHMAGDSGLFNTLGQIPNSAFPGNARARPLLLAIAMTGYSWLDKI